MKISPTWEIGEINQAQESQRVPYRIKPRRHTPGHILIKLPKVKHKERTLKASREKQQATYKENPTCLMADHSAETAGQMDLIQN